MDSSKSEESHEITAPHNPEQNGKVEREWEIRTLLESARSMIFVRKLNIFVE